MLTVNARGIGRLALMSMLLYGLPSVACAQDFSPSTPPQGTVTPQPSRQTPVGAPQVLEIPPVQEPQLPTTTNTPVPPHRTSYMEGVPVDDLSPESYSPQVRVRRTYLGLRYVSSEEEDGGVMVIDTLADSPAARAGFIGERTSTSPTGTEQIMKMAMAALVMTPAAPAVVPLAIAHEMFLACRPRGDVIVAIGDRFIRDAQDFNDAMRHYHPGDQVVFSVKRCGKPLQISAQLEEEPEDPFYKKADDLPTLSRDREGFDMRASGTNFPP